MCPFSSLAFLQPTTVDKEPIFIEYKKENFRPITKGDYLKFSFIYKLVP